MLVRIQNHVTLWQILAIIPVTSNAITVLEEMVMRASRETTTAGRIMIVVGKNRTERDKNAITGLKLPGTMLIKNTIDANRNEVRHSKHAVVRVRLFNKCIK